MKCRAKYQKSCKWQIKKKNTKKIAASLSVAASNVVSLLLWYQEMGDGQVAATNLRNELTDLPLEAESLC